MTKHIPIILLSVFFLSGCYTLLKPIPPSAQEIENRRVMGMPFTADPALLGNWSNTISAMDGPNDVRNLTFYTDGKVLFSSSGHVKNGGHRVGTYRIIDDTLAVLFASSYFMERFLYSFESGQLILTSLRQDTNEIYALAEYSSIRYLRKPL